MNTNKESHLHRTPLYRRPLVIVTFLSIVIIVAIITILIFAFSRSMISHETSSDDSESTQTNTSDEVFAESDTSWDNTPVQYEGGNVDSSESLTGGITYQNIHQGVLYIGTTIDQYLTAGGTCEVALYDSSETLVYHDYVDAFADVATSACDTISIPITQLSSGTYQIKITLSGDNKNGIITDGVELL